MQWPIEQASRVADAGGIIAYPTEAVYGLGCNPLDATAVLRLLMLKRRKLEQGLILVAADKQQLLDYVDFPGGDVEKQIDQSWPGPVTWVLPANDWVPYWLTGDHDTLAVRVSNHSRVRDLCTSFGGPLVSTSANTHGHPPARSAHRVRAVFGDKIDFVLAGDTGGQDKPTEIRDARTGKILRAS